MQIIVDIDEYEYKRVKELVTSGLFDYEGITPHLFKGVANSTPFTEQSPKKGEWLRMSDLSEQEDDRY